MVRACVYDSLWRRGTGNYNGIGILGGKVYYALCSASLDGGGAIFRFDPSDGGIVKWFDLDAVEVEPGRARIPQGKVHAPLFEFEGRMIVTTHVGHYALDGKGRELKGTVPAGVAPYRGGLVMAVDTDEATCEILAAAPGGEGIIAAGLDPLRARLTCLTWPTGRLFSLNLRDRSLADHGGFSGEGELGTGASFHKLCRAVGVCPDDGSAWMTNSTGALFRLDAGGRLECVSPDALRRDVFGNLDPHGYDTMGYQWRQVAWSPHDHLFFAVHPESEMLFSLDPATARIEVIERLASEPVRRRGTMGGGASLGLRFAPDGHTLYFFAWSGESADLALKVSGAEEPVVQPWPAQHLVRYDVRSGRRRDLGKVVLEDGRTPYHCNSMAIAEDGTIYSVPFIVEPWGVRSDLVCLPRVAREEVP